MNNKLYGIKQKYNCRPTIYVACMNAYKNGLIHGRWIDATLSIQEMKDSINEMLLCSPYRYTVDEEKGISPNKHNWWEIHDCQFFHGINLYRSIFTTGSMYIQRNHELCLPEINAIAKEIDKLQCQGKGENKTMIFISMYLKYDLKKAIGLMQDNYLGCFDSEKEFIISYAKKNNLLNGCGKDILEHINYTSLLDKVMQEGSVFSVVLHGKHHYFSNG